MMMALITTLSQDSLKIRLPRAGFFSEVFLAILWQGGGGEAGGVYFGRIDTVLIWKIREYLKFSDDWKDVETIYRDKHFFSFL